MCLVDIFQSTSRRAVPLRPLDFAQSRAQIVQDPFARDVQSFRSEEHTSELQSQSNLVCRLLLEKKKIRSSTCPIISSSMTPSAFPIFHSSRPAVTGSDFLWTPECSSRRCSCRSV